MTIERLSTALADRYTIDHELGAGGMATVYLAHDIRHHRQVAIKVLRPELAAVIGAERFLAEIKTTANLQHPHILPLHDSGEVDGTVFYVMPFVEGESLRDRLTREHQLPVADAVRIATEVAGALDYAHRHGVIHRDIKPENILLHDGQALVADFGIALAASRSEGGTRMTETGMSLGTPHYMSPEQAMGEREITARTDVYALGCVLYEMLVGEPPFTGPTAQAIIARVMTEEPRSLTVQRKTIPPGIEAVVRTALQKLPADRFASAAEFAEALQHPERATATMAAVSAPRMPTRRTWLMLAGVAVIALAIGLGVGRLGRRSPRGDAGVVRATLSLGDSATIQNIQNAVLAISPDGRRVAFAGQAGTQSSLWMRDLADDQARALPGTRVSAAPFFSPDGESVGFITGGTGGTLLAANIMVTAATGGAVRTVIQGQAAGFGASWGDDGYIYFADPSHGLARVPAAGGAIEVVSHPDSSKGVLEEDFPDVLPGSRFAIVSVWKGNLNGIRIGVVDLRNGHLTDLTSGSYGRYVAPGFLAIGSATGDVLVGRFDPRRGVLIGAPALVLSGVQREGINGTVQFAVSANGTLVYAAGGSASDRLVWVNRDGGVTPVDSTADGLLTTVALSPDGTRAAVARIEAAGPAVWIQQLATGALTRLSINQTDADRAAWTPDGKSVAYLGSNNGHRTVWIRRADASDTATAMSPPGLDLDEVLFDPRGRYTIYRSFGSGVGTRRLLITPSRADSAPRPLVSAKYDNYAATLSPDGNWLAYNTEESGQPEVVVRPFPHVDSARFAISVGGGVEPLWRRDGKELFYRSQRGDMFAVPTTIGATFTHGQPQRLFANPGLLLGLYFRTYDVSPDGKRFLMVSSGDRGSHELAMVLHWTTTLQQLGK